MATHIRLVAFEVEGDTPADADKVLMPALTPLVGTVVECWWVAEDDRTDGSDRDSAVFVAGSQADAYNALRRLA